MQAGLMHVECLQVPKAYIQRLELVPDIDNSQVEITVHGSPAAGGLHVTAVVKADGAKVATAEGKVGEAFTVPISKPKLWSPDSPFLYDLDVTLQPPPSNVSHVSSLPSFLMSDTSVPLHPYNLFSLEAVKTLPQPIQAASTLDQD